MEWLKNINDTIQYIEDNLTKDLSNEEIAKQAFSSNAHYQRLFNIVTGITIGEYIRNRKLSMAGQDLLLTDSKVIDIALRYNYESSESFSKAFTRFHGIRPSEAKIYGDKLRYFYPLSIDISIQGGFNKTNRFTQDFIWNKIVLENCENLTDEEKYRKVIIWASTARVKNPSVFDDLSEWILDDEEWSEDKLVENKQILMQGVFARFKKQNIMLRNFLLKIKKPNIVNPAVFKALDRFDEELSGITHSENLKNVVPHIFKDFTIMKDKSIREQVADFKIGFKQSENKEKTFFSYINILKDCDAAVQWALFMPDLVKKQQILFKLKSFEYKSLPEFRFIGKKCDSKDKKELAKIFEALDLLREYNTEFNDDLLFHHHNGECVENENEHNLWGRFMKANTPVPDGFTFIDFVPFDDDKNGMPYISQFAYSTFKGSKKAMNKDGRMYVITRNIMLGQGVTIPYPNKYWVATVFLKGYKKPSTAFMFCADLIN